MSYNFGSGGASGNYYDYSGILDKYKKNVPEEDAETSKETTDETPVIDYSQQNNETTEDDFVPVDVVDTETKSAETKTENSPNAQTSQNTQSPNYYSSSYKNIFDRYAHVSSSSQDDEETVDASVFDESNGDGVSETEATAANVSAAADEKPLEYSEEYNAAKKLSDSFMKYCTNYSEYDNLLDAIMTGDISSNNELSSLYPGIDWSALTNLSSVEKIQLLQEISNNLSTGSGNIKPVKDYFYNHAEIFINEFNQVTDSNKENSRNEITKFLKEMNTLSKKLGYDSFFQFLYSDTQIEDDTFEDFCTHVDSIFSQDISIDEYIELTNLFTDNNNNPGNFLDCFITYYINEKLESPYLQKGLSLLPSVDNSDEYYAANQEDFGFMYSNISRTMPENATLNQVLEKINEYQYQTDISDKESLYLLSMYINQNKQLNCGIDENQYKYFMQLLSTK